MTETSTSMSINRSSVQTELFRPSLNYSVHPYADMLARTAERYPENEAVLFRDLNLSYRELDALVNAFANALLDLGIRAGQKVSLFMTNRPEYLISWFAITRVGAVVSPINPSYKEREVAYQLSNSGSVAIVVQDSLLPLVETVRAELPALKYVIAVGSGQHGASSTPFAFSHLVRAYPPTPPTGLEIAWEDVIALPYSSGTTGLPKGCCSVTKIWCVTRTSRLPRPASLPGIVCWSSCRSTTFMVLC